MSILRLTTFIAVLSVQPPCCRYLTLFRIFRLTRLLKGKGVTDDPVDETYWKVANGIRLTGMPAYQGFLTNDQLWQE
jgi:hypothetical protein